MNYRRIMAGTCILAGIASIGLANEWSQFRGPGGAGLPDSDALPAEWSAEKNVQWKVKIPGAAWSSPIVWGDKVFVTTAVTDKQTKPRPGGGFGGGGGGFGGGGFGGGGRFGDDADRPEGAGRPEGPQPKRANAPNSESPNPQSKDAQTKDNPDKSSEQPNDRPRFGNRGPGGRPGDGFGGRGGMGRGGPPPDVVYTWEVHCLDRGTGKTLWKTVALEKKPAISTHRSNTYASETPLCDGERVYAYFGMHGLFCLDMQGKLLWKKELGSFPMMAGWGTGSSPALDGDLVFVQCDNEQKSFLVALNKKTGDEVWRVDRTERSSWSTPFVWRAAGRTETGGRTEVVACGGNRITSYAAATGKVVWELGGISGSCNATPVAGDGLLFVGAGGRMGNSPLFAVKEGASGDITLKDGETSNAGVAWSRTKAGPSMASPLFYKGLLYILEQRGGMISCYNAKTGEPAYYRKRLPDAHGFTSSPWAYGDKIFCLDEDGRTTVLKAGLEGEVIGQNNVGEMCWSSPAFDRGALLLRGVDSLFCIGH